jgi:hypothetical protein
MWAGFIYIKIMDLHWTLLNNVQNLQGIPWPAEQLLPSQTALHSMNERNMGYGNLAHNV